MNIGLEDMGNVRDSLNVLYLVYLLIVMIVQELLNLGEVQFFFSSSSFRPL